MGARRPRQGPKGILAQTADGPYDPASGKFGNTVVALTPEELPLAGFIHSGELGISESKRIWTSAQAIRWSFRSRNGRWRPW